MNITSIHLPAGVQLSSMPPTLSAPVTHLEGPTGIGKTTWLLNELTKTQRLVLVVPTRSQLFQLKSQYGQRESLAFVSGDDKGALDSRYLSRQDVVCTYDQLFAVRRKLGLDEQKRRVLVIDEAHKMYQAGGYRASAIHNLLVNFKANMQWARIVTVSATFSPFLIELAGLKPQEWIKVTQEDRPIRQFEAIYYHRKDFALWPDAILAQAKRPHRRGTIIVRVNSRAQIDSLFHTYKLAGLNCQRVHADIQDEQQMKRLLAVQKIDAGIDILLTTSLIDEAINLNNPNETIDSVHIIDNRTHPEEITQFVGRFRHANPRVYLHLRADEVIGYCEDFPSTMDADEFEEMLYENLRSEYAVSLNAANGTKDMVSMRRARNVAGLRLMVQEMNATHRRFLGFAPLRLEEAAEVGRCKIHVNTGSLLAQVYRDEAECSYVLHEFLVRQLQKQMPGCVVTRSDANPAPRSHADDELYRGGAKEAEEEDRQVKITVINELRTLLRNRPVADLAEAAVLLVKSFGASSLHGKVCQDIADVLAVVPDFDQAVKIIWKDEKDAVLTAYNGFSDLIVKNLHSALKEALKERKGEDLKVDGKTACKLVIAAARAAVKQDPSLKQSMTTLRGQKSGLRTKKNNHITVDVRTALTLIRQHAWTNRNVDNAEEPRKRGVITVSGIYYGNYHFKGQNERKTVGRLEDEFLDYAPKGVNDTADEAA
jgi:superfamily II DNA/RNA helicase